jgi:hypothetical protein
MRRLIVMAGAAALVVLGAAPAAGAATVPAEFGSSWDNPRTAAPAVPKPPTASCTTRIVDHAFVDYSTYVNTYVPPAACAGPWSKVVLRLDGAVAGRQFDRLGWITVGGVEVFKTSTPEPSPAGIRWSVEKDVTGYAALLRAPQTVNMFLGNIVDDTYTGVLAITVDLTFYAADRTHPAPASATDVIALAGAAHPDGQDQTGTVQVPGNAERLLAEVYATGSGGGCEEFWYLTAPSSTGYSCPADPGPYREVQVLLDGRLAGIAAPFPHVYTGGWSNPFLWYVVPAPRAFDIQPITYDLTPFLGLLTDGAPHQVAVHVVGVPAGQPGWDTPIDFLAWRDAGSAHVSGGLLADHAGTLTDDVTTGTREVTTRGRHSVETLGYVQTSHGRITTAVTSRVGNDSVHTWGDGENPDTLHATWTDDSTDVVSGTSRFAGVTRSAKRYALDGSISVGADNRLTTTITMTDAATDDTVGPRGLRHRTLEDTYTGEAAYLLGVPRDQRHAVGTSKERYRLGGDVRYDRTIATRNGIVTGG